MDNFDQDNGNTATTQALNRIIKPNMERRAKSLATFTILCLVGIFVCFVAFGATSIIVTLSQHGGFSFIILFPFGGFLVFGLLASIVGFRAATTRAITSILKHIKASEEVELADIRFKYKNTYIGALPIINLLISTGNLKNYHIIDGKAITKDHITKSSAISSDREKSTICECGTTLTDKDNYCPKCGKRTFF